MSGLNMIFFIVQQTMYFSIPLLIVALGGLFAERSGIINIALEGTMVIGAFAGTLFIHFVQNAIPGQPVLLLALLVSAAAGVLISVVHAFASINMRANQTISGTAINIFATAFVIFVARMVLGVQQVDFANQFRIESVPVLGDIPILGPLLFQKAYITTYIGIAILILSWLFLYKTPFGMRLRACGEHPQAADSVGIKVARMRWTGTLLSGALAGIGGLVFVIPTSTSFNATVSGYGFLALAVLIFGQWRPWLIAAAAFFFGIMKALSSIYSAIPFLLELGLPSNVYKMIPYVATLIVLAFTGRNSRAPKAEGIPYDKGSR